MLCGGLSVDWGARYCLHRIKKNERMNNPLIAKSSEWAVRIGLGLMYIYSGIDFLRHPTAWYWAIAPLPDFIRGAIMAIGLDRYLMMQGLGELILALIFLIPFAPRILLRIAAVLAAFEMASILLFVGIDAITFRDIGLLGAAVSLFFMTFQPKEVTSAQPFQQTAV